jgi:hypothetical protein
MRSILAIILALLAVPLLKAQSLSGLRTLGYVNGRYWSTLSLEAKATYIIALDEGALEIISYSKTCACAADASVSMLTAISGGDSNSYLELVEALDSFYKDSPNRAIPVIKALPYITLKIRGGTSRELDDLISKLRKEANP